MSPKLEVAMSNVESATESACPSIISTSALSAASITCWRSTSTIPGAKSVASTLAPRRAASNASAPVPAATSSSRRGLEPVRTPSSSSIEAAKGAVRGTIARS
jgi:hypothetical protein